ncbi:ATP-dependent helicase HrpB [Bradyrhizobium japonicum]|uniref:ATP-dependent helicase HrpB n=1 Tax=Bradyrhizobium TaxID=374 RepID=UPI000429E9CE|nr:MULTISPECIES: ATP-dependent helicase HrpB [Bradyrhizobium]MBR0879334.1 ATP-dependent helicase HrpB [Bradyrhizobium liaoningense]MBR0998593.1 ATP-dependent helicase HrpB [Bradyrhizobium liaoningense]MBR1063566.1 ATP-dependent helicase HrpB [Bradyrhizobium liaoningense]MCP1746133.1 ATP-dependent helicase HrpB [Bradyrhizobium japonicum]MCP1773812.1 ATP-dependent helicase HrpB [Bradyrhizobium japonicum]
MPRSFDTPLPIDAVLDDLSRTLEAHNSAVLVAPPGAGKTTRVPLALLDAPWAAGKKIIVLEPRRIAARASAERMAKSLGERAGETVGYRVRFGSKISRTTRIEVVTEGIFTRQILDDPELSGIAAVLFDEFHERSLDADMGLALARDSQTGLREDLRILVMSATLDGARVAKLLGEAPVVESEGRAFPVETRYLGRKADAPVERQMADAIASALRADSGSVLAFLPGAAEIRRTQNFLSERVQDASIEIVPLFGALDAAVQDRAIAPAPKGTRKVVLATSIAETSLTIEGVRIVVDSGLARVPRYEPDIGLTRLETVRAARAAVDQRRGRAGRTEPGVCYRLWDEPQTASLAPYTQPEILSADLSSLVLDLAQWGVADPSALSFLDPPPLPAWKEAKSLLSELNALDGDGRITAEGKSLRALALPPRLARMIVDSHRVGSGEAAAEIAAIVTERGLGGDSVDLEYRRDQFRRDRSPRAASARDLARRWASQVAASEKAVTGQDDLSIGLMLAYAFPDRVARNRGNGTFVLANGRGAAVEQTSSLARAPYIAIGEMTGTAASGRVLLAAPISEDDIERHFAEHIETVDEISFDRGAMALRARRKRALHAITLSEATLAVSPSEETARIFADGLIAAGLDRLPWSKAAKQWRDRVMFLRKAEGDSWPDLTDGGLIARRDDWLVPALYDKIALKDISAGDLSDALMALLPWEMRARLDREAPTHFEAPTGSVLAIDYEAEQGPTIAVRLQELFGLNTHPSIAAGKVPLVLELLSPAQRPVQVTRDLPGFWRGSYAAVRSDLRGRYPRHPWPEDPASALPTRRVKPRGT